MLIFYKVSSIINFWKSLLLLAALYLLTLPSESTAQSINLRFESLTSENGLSQNSVRSIYQDSRQFLWFGTFDGLNRYDGFNFRIYKYDKDDPYSISGQVFSAIVEDKNGDLWIASEGNGLNRYNRLTDNFTRFLKIQNDTTSLADNRLKVLYVDKKGRLWVGTDNGLCRYDFQKNNFIRYNKILDTENHFQSQLIRAICEDSSGNIWIGTWFGLIKLNPETNEYKYYYSNASDPNSLSSSYIGSVYLDKENNIWLGTSEGLNKYNEDSDNFIRYNIDYLSKSSDKNISDIIQDNEGDIWLATNINGLIKFDPHTSTFTNFIHDKIDKGSLSSNILFSLFEDKTGIIWVGTDGGGVCKLNKRKSQFRYLSDNQINNNSLSSDKVYSIIEDKKGIIWIGTYGGGLNRFDPNAEDKKITKYVYDPNNTNSLVDNRIRSLCEDDNGNIWIGTDNGVSRLNIAARKFKNYFAGDNSHLSGRTIFDIKKLRDGTIIIGIFGGGLDIYDKKNDQFISFNPDPNNNKSINSNLIWTIFQDSKNNIWVGTQGGGLNLFDINKKEFQHFVNDPNNPRTLSHNTVLTMIEDKDSNLWIGTNYGINKMIRGNDGQLSFENYTVKDGLPDNNIQSILLDDKGFMWIGTNKGLSKFDTRKLTFENFDVSDGIRSNEFFVHACYKRKSTGELMFGSNKGFNIFYPDNIKQDLFPPKVVITDFLLFNNQVQIGARIDDDIILNKSITETKELVLSYKHNIISFEFAALNFAAPDKNSFAYILEGFDADWNYVGNRHFANYTSIAPGTYVFKVKAANSNGIWSEQTASIKIIIVPPFYSTAWFRVLVSIIVVFFGYIGYQLKLRSLRKREDELRQLVNEKTKLNEQLIKENRERKQAEGQLLIAKEKAEGSERLKSEFLAQMSHEIRSPINTIFNFTDLIKSNLDLTKDEELKECFDSIERAGDRIVRTIDLILNMSEIQTGSYECIYKELDLNDILANHIFPEFSYKAKKKNLELVLNIDRSPLHVIADEYSLVQIFVNIIDNAIKYTKQGKVEIFSFRNDNNKAVIKIADTGIGISEEYLANIFTAFFQEQQGYTRQYEGNGLGLALVKKYCDINDAEIFVESKKGDGSVFTVIFNKTL